jgi:hypothetical protein
MTEEVTFRDFAGALMGGDAAGAATVLETLLGLDRTTAENAAAHFRDQMTENPAFLQRAMGMRQVVEVRDEGELTALLVECFGLSDEAAEKSAATVLARYR